MLDSRFLLDELVATQKIGREGLVQLLQDDNINEAIYVAADKLRERYVGDGVHLRGLVEFSNFCRQNCLYCGLRRDNRQVKRYRLSCEEVLTFAQAAKELGYQTLVMQSGEDDYYTRERLVEIISAVKKLGFALTLSIGERELAEYEAFRQAGADRFLLRIETTNPVLYEKFHPGMSQENRFLCLENLRKAGFEVGTGCLVGLPGQTLADIAADLLFFQSIDIDMIGLGPFIPNPDTPLGSEQGGSFDLARKVLSLARLLCPDANIPATTAMETLAVDGRMLALTSGANVIMPNVTEGEFRRLYQLYPGKAGMNDSPENSKLHVSEKIRAMGRTVAIDKGFRKKR